MNGLTKATAFNFSFYARVFCRRHNYKEDVYLICCDADVARGSLFIRQSRIKYLVPNRRVKAPWFVWH